MWIDLGPRLAQKALERIDVFRLAEEKDDDVIELYYVSLEGSSSTRLAAVEAKTGGEGIAIESLLEQRCAVLANGRKFPMNSLFLNGPWCARKSRR
jgi:hypothetical protein